MAGDKCDVCGGQSIGVCSSAMGAVSFAYCQECNLLGREPWAALVGGLIGCGPDHVAEWVKPIIKVTCEFFNMTEEQLWAEVKKTDEEYEAYCRDADLP